MLVLSITILATVLVTGTVVNIVSAANSINVQTKTSHATLTSIGSPHTLLSRAHGISLQTKHAVTKPLGTGRAVTKPSSQCYNIISGAHKDTTCIAEFRGVWINPTQTLYDFQYGGKLLGCVGEISPAPKEIMITKCVGGPPLTPNEGWKPLDNAAIEIKVYIGNDKHEWYTPGVVTKTRADGTFDGSFSLCDKPQYSDHAAHLITYLNIPPADEQEVKGSTIPGPYAEPVSSSVTFTTQICKSLHAHFTDMQITPMPTNPIGWYIKGRLVGEGDLPLTGAPVIFSAKYLDDTPTHPHQFIWSSIPYQQTMAGGTISTSFGACDKLTGSGYRSDALFYAKFPNPTGRDIQKWSDYFPATWPTEGFAFTTKPCP